LGVVEEDWTIAKGPAVMKPLDTRKLENAVSTESPLAEDGKTETVTETFPEKFRPVRRTVGKNNSAALMVADLGWTLTVKSESTT
jgi:hypothetical protein